MSLSCHCEDAKKAKAYISPPEGEQIIILSEKPPICYEIKEESALWEYGGEGLKGDCKPSGRVVTHTHRGQKPKFETRTAPSGGNFAGCSFAYVILDGVSNYPDFEGGGHPATTFVRRVGEESGDSQSGELGFTVMVKDESGEIYNEFFPGEKSPTVEVACDDNCPEGYLKCTSDKYPGYCCLPCKRTANKIRALGNRL